jgi:hypothetical protein
MIHHITSQRITSYHNTTQHNTSQRQLKRDSKESTKVVMINGVPVSTHARLHMLSSRVGRYSELPTVITTLTKPYCNYGNYDTVLFLHAGVLALL